MFVPSPDHNRHLPPETAVQMAGCRIPAHRAGDMTALSNVEPPFALAVMNMQRYFGHFGVRIRPVPPADGGNRGPLTDIEWWPLYRPVAVSPAPAHQGPFEIVCHGLGWGQPEALPVPTLQDIWWMHAQDLPGMLHDHFLIAFARHGGDPRMPKSVLTEWVQGGAPLPVFQGDLWWGDLWPPGALEACAANWYRFVRSVGLPRAFVLDLDGWDGWDLRQHVATALAAHEGDALDSACPPAGDTQRTKRL